MIRQTKKMAAGAGRLRYSYEEVSGVARMQPWQVVQSLLYFLLAGLAEIGGGYLVWQWLREGKSLWWGLLGALLLVLYGVLPTLQPAGLNFGRVYAAYGGVFVVLSLWWGWQVDQVIPDRFDILGAGLALVGVAVLLYWPRG